MENNNISKLYFNNFSEWYNNIISLADLAENSDVRGCMILKPYGYSIWENIQKILDDKFKCTGHQNAYFPLFIPKSYFCKEASHVEGFAKECAVITHYRLKNKDNSIVVDENAKLEDEYIVRPTSETIIWNTFKKWIKSYRDLPIKINQWANVCRWEMRTRPFLRTSEFLWQEGHTAHDNIDDARKETLQMLDVYYNFGKDYLAIPFIKGIKTENEKFAGAEETYTVEALMKDGKALQCGTSHLLGQNFAKAFDVKYLNKDNKLEYVWGTSWGVSTRLIGAIIMTHGDDKGLILPPKIAPIQIVIIPLDNNESINNIVDKLNSKLLDNNISVKIDNRDYLRPGFKFTEWELKGIPIRIVIGKKDIENNTVEITRRDNNEKIHIPIDSCLEKLKDLLTDIQDNLYNKALEFRKNHTFEVDNYDDFKGKINNRSGFIISPWDGTTETELKIKEETQATIRCIPFENKDLIINNNDNDTCILSNNKSKNKVIFALNY